MKRKSTPMACALLCLSGGTVLASSCAADLRDALTAGAIGAITETTTQILSQLIIPDDGE